MLIVANTGREWRGLPADLVVGPCSTAEASYDVHYSTVEAEVYKAARFEVFRLDMAESVEQKDVDVAERCSSRRESAKPAEAGRSHHHPSPSQKVCIGAPNWSIEHHPCRTRTATPAFPPDHSDSYHCKHAAVTERSHSLHLQRPTSSSTCTHCGLTDQLRPGSSK